MTENGSGKEPKYKLESNITLRKNQLSCSGGSFYGMIIGNKIDFYLTEIYNFSGMFKKPWPYNNKSYFKKLHRFPASFAWMTWTQL